MQTCAISIASAFRHAGGLADCRGLSLIAPWSEIAAGSAGAGSGLPIELRNPAIA